MQEGLSSKNEVLNSGSFTIDGDEAPKLGKSSTLIEHRQHGKIEFNPDLFEIRPCFIDQNATPIEAEKKFKQEVSTLPVVNSNVVDFLLKHQELIPEAWKYGEDGYPRFILFAGTQFICGGRLDTEPSLCVKGMTYDNSEYRETDPEWIPLTFHFKTPKYISDFYIITFKNLKNVPEE